MKCLICRVKILEEISIDINIFCWSNNCFVSKQQLFRVEATIVSSRSNNGFVSKQQLFRVEATIVSCRSNNGFVSKQQLFRIKATIVSYQSNNCFVSKQCSSPGLLVQAVASALLYEKGWWWEGLVAELGGDRAPPTLSSRALEPTPSKPLWPSCFSCNISEEIVIDAFLFILI